MQELRVQLEGDSVRKTVGVEMKLKALDEQTKEEVGGDGDRKRLVARKALRDGLWHELTRACFEITCYAASRAQGGGSGQDFGARGDH